MFISILLAAVITNAVGLADAICEERADIGFDIEGVVTLPNKRGTWHMAIEDDSGGVLFRNHTPEHDSVFFKPGDRLRIRGSTATSPTGVVYAQCTQAVVTAEQSAPVPTPATAGEIFAGNFDNRLVKVTGTVREVFKDEIDPRWVYLILNCNGSRIAVVLVWDSDDISMFTALTDATVSVTGVCTPITHGIRRVFGRHISCFGADSIQVKTPAPADPFNVPFIGFTHRISPFDVDRMGRRRISGRVAAVWGDKNLLVIDSKGKNHRIELASGDPPSYGDNIEATGIPETDLYSIHLIGALWRASTNSTSLADNGDSSVLAFSDFYDEKFGRLNRFMKYNGRTARFRGPVVSIELGKVKYRNCTIRCEDFTIGVNSGTAGDFPEDIEIGAQVEVTGTCVISSGIWHPTVSFPHIEDAPMVVLRHPGDMKVIESPPWWTPLRLTIVIGVLLVLLAAIMLWAITLKFVAERHSRQLFKSQIGKAEETLRVEERTRLAVELHDSIAQSLTGAAFQIKAARDSSAHECSSSSYLACAEQILKSCRTELRRCIWDLKSHALEEQDLNKAILSTVRPIAGGSDVHIHFNVPRRLMNDTTAHAILRIIRELVANAVQHGRATRIRIAGELADSRLHFSVRDNGCGFDLNSCPGPATGHFGLDGIRERIDKFGGTLNIETARGGGTRVEISIHKPHAKTMKGE